MQKLKILIIFLFCSILVNGQKQVNNLQFKQVDKNYTWRTAQEQRDNFYFNLTPVRNSKMQKHIRFYATGIIIDLFTNDNQLYEGFVITYIYDYVYDKKTDNSERKHIIFEKISLDSEKVKLVMERLIERQFEIPTDSLIQNWSKYIADGYGIEFTFKIDKQFKTQYYGNPKYQNDSVDYKHIIVDNHNYISTTFNLDSINKVFKNKLPKGKSYSSGNIIICILTDRDVKKWNKNKPIRDYMEFVSDTINNYLKTELLKQNIMMKNDCRDDYLIIFGKNGKLKKVKIYDSDKPKLKDYYGDFKGFLEDKREIRKCQLEIKKIFKNMNLSFIKPKYKIYRTFTFIVEWRNEEWKWKYDLYEDSRRYYYGNYGDKK